MLKDFKIENGILKEYLGTQTHVEIPNGVREIGCNAFSENAAITKVTVPDSVTKIGENAFLRCEMLNTVHLPESIEQIDSHAFGYCYALKKIRIPQKTERISLDAFIYCEKINEFTVAYGNPNYRAIDGNLYTSNDTVLIAYACGKKDCEFVAPEGVRVVNANAFFGCHSIKSVSFADGLEQIGQKAFMHCTNLENAVLPNSIKEWGADLFNSCRKLKSITIPPSVREIPYQTFYGCNSLTEIYIPEGVTTVNDAAFSGCTSLRRLTAHGKLNDLNSSGLCNCRSLEEIFFDSDIARQIQIVPRDLTHVLLRGWLLGKDHRPLTPSESEKLNRYLANLTQDDNSVKIYSKESLFSFITTNNFLQFLLDNSLICVTSAIELFTHIQNAEIKARFLNYINENKNDLGNLSKYMLN